MLLRILYAAAHLIFGLNLQKLRYRPIVGLPRAQMWVPTKTSKNCQLSIHISASERDSKIVLMRSLIQDNGACMLISGHLSNQFGQGSKSCCLPCSCRKRVFSCSEANLKKALKLAQPGLQFYSFRSHAHFLQKRTWLKKINSTGKTWSKKKMKST